MLKNYLKVTFRNLLKNKVYVSINVIGLGLALACCIVAYLNSKFNWDFNKNHEKIENIYKVHSMVDRDGLTEYGRVPMPMIDAIKNDLAGVDEAFRFEGHVFTVRDEELDKVFSSNVSYADPGFLKAFTFPVIQGDPSSFHQIENAVVTSELAKKFYGEEDPIGKVLTVFDDTGVDFNFVISAVVEKAPQNSSIGFEILVAFENRYRMYDDGVKGNWESFAQASFLYFNDPSQAENLAPLLDKYVAVQNQAREDFQVSSFKLAPMITHGKNSRSIRWDNLQNPMDDAAVITPQIMAILILLVACFNFTNTAIANSNRRLKEIGVRKVLGGGRKQLIIQFMAENLTVCFLAVLLSLGIAGILVPAYSAMWEGMDLKLDFTQDFRIYLFLIGLLIFTTVLAGFYPSLYISKYKPVSILRGSLSIGGAGRLTKVLLTAQYSFTVIALFASVAFVQNARYQDTLDMGYNRSQTIGINLLNDNQYQKIKASMLANPDIQMIASAKNHIGRGNYGTRMKHQDLEKDVSMMDVGIGYMETMDLRILEGRTFTKELEASDSKNSIIVNEKLVEEFGWIDPIGQRVAVDDSTTLTVVGVVQDFYMYGFWAPVEPYGIRLQSLRFEDDGTYSFIVAKADISKVRDVYDYLEDEWNAQIPNKTYSGFFQDELLSEAREINSNILKVFSFLGGVAFIMSCLGLFTLVSINLIKKIKEIGVRKVLGSSIQNIVVLMNRQYLILLMISSIIGATAGYFLIDGLISSIFNQYKSMDFFTFVVPTIIILVVSLGIASFKTLVTALVNPVTSLRYE